MTDANDEGIKSPDAEGTEGSPEKKVTEPDPIASARKRQAGAEAARQVAETKLREQTAELDAFRASKLTDDEKGLSELARLTERLSAAEKRADEAVAKAEARVLDAKFPNARKELPEVTDEVRLAKFEAILSDSGGSEEPPTPGRHNESKGSGAAVAAGAKKEETSEDIKARLLAMPTPVGWGQ